LILSFIPLTSFSRPSLYSFSNEILSSIYPALKSLKDLGFLIEEKEGKTITYGLSPKGERALEIAKKRFTRTFLGIIT